MTTIPALTQAYGLIPDNAHTIDVKDSEGHYSCTSKHVIPKVAKALRDGETFIVKINSCNWLVYEFSNGLTVKFHVGQLPEA